MADLQQWIEKLNPAQKEAVLEMHHPLLVLAGAGSGKTRVITTKIAYCVEKLGIQPWEILSVTFTNKAAGEMRERAYQMLPFDQAKNDQRAMRGFPGDYRDDLFIKTFHSFGAWFLRRYGDLIGLNTSFNIYDDSDSLSILQRAFPQMKKKELSPIMKIISKVKDQGLGPNDNLSKYSYQFEVAKFYQGYERVLRSTGNVDFADLITLTAKTLRIHQEVREKLQHRFKVILVDEYQDSNKAQFNLLKQLKGPESLICVVGDDDQSIYRFRGAEVKNILSFPQDYPGTRIIKLEQNYRSTGGILAVASSVIKHNTGRYDKTLTTDKGQGKKPILHHVYSGKDEIEAVAKILKKDGNYDGSAILYRTNAQAAPFEMYFKKKDIPYKIIGSLSFYDREEIKDVISLLYLFQNTKDVISFQRMINKPGRGIGKSSQEKILQLMPQNNDDVMLSLKHAIDTKIIPSRAIANASSFLKTMEEAYKMVVDHSLIEAVVYLIEETGLKDYYTEIDKKELTERVGNLDQLVNALSDYESSLEGLYQFLDTVALDHSKIGQSDPSDRPGVTLITMHNTKGLEFDRVFMVGLEEGLFPRETVESQSDDEEEERRIFYVATTRAKTELHLFTATSRMQWGHYENDRKPSRFLQEIDEGLVKVVGKKSTSSGYNGYSSLGEKRSYDGGSYQWGQSSGSSYGNNTSSYGSSWKKRQAPIQNMVSTGFSEKPKAFQFETEQEDAPKTLFRKGDRIFSEKKGKGWIMEVLGKGDREVLSVRFDSGINAKYRAEFARLEKIAED